MSVEPAPRQNHATRREYAAHRRAHRLPKAAPGACTPTDCPLYASRLGLSAQPERARSLRYDWKIILPLEFE
jgi:hypothetical protein